MNNTTVLMQETPLRRFCRLIVNNLLYILVACAFVALAFSSPYFLVSSNLIAILRDNAPVMMAAIAVTFTLTSGNMDLSVGSIVLASASFGGLLITKLDVNPYLGLVCMVVAGTIMGAINAFLIVVVKLNPWLVTLGTQLGYKGVAYTLTYADTILLPEDFKTMRNFAVGEFPVYVIFALCMFLVMHLVMTRTIYGRNVVAIGTSMKAAEKIGININKTKFLVYTITGFMAGISACLSSINYTAVVRDCGKSYEFLGVAAAVLGGCSMSGGSAKVFPGTLLGVLIIALMENGLAINGVDPYFFPIFRGLIIFSSMAFSAMKMKKL